MNVVVGTSEAEDLSHVHLVFHIPKLVVAEEESFVCNPGLPWSSVDIFRGNTKAPREKKRSI